MNDLVFRRNYAGLPFQPQQISWRAVHERNEREYLQFLNVATGSAAEAEYLLSVAFRLGMLPREVNTRLAGRYSELLRGLQALITSLDATS